MDEATESGTLSSVNRALDVLEAFSSTAPERGLSELSRLLGASKPTLHRLLRNLEARGYLRQDPSTRRYRLGLKAWEVGALAVRDLAPQERAQPCLARIATETGEQATLWVHDGDSCVCVGKREGSYPLRTYTRLGVREPAHLMATGRCLLAFAAGADPVASLPLDGQAADALRAQLEVVRRRGYDISRGDRWPDVYAVAAPVRDYTGAAVAALAVSGPRARLKGPRLRQLADLMLQVAGALSGELGGPGDPGRRRAI